MATTLSISLLGPLRVALDETPVSEFKYNKARALLAYLAAEGGRGFSRAELCTLLWPELAERAARRNLTQVLTSLRDALNGAETETLWLLTNGETVSFNFEAAVQVDVARFSALLTASERHAHRSWLTCNECAERLAEAAALYHGEFLSQMSVSDSATFEEWALVWRERLRQRAMTTLERLAQRAEWCGAYAQAVEYARRLVELDDLREASQRELLRLLALDGQPSAAEAQYEQLRRLLRAELRVEPETETLKLAEQIHTGQTEHLQRYAAPPMSGPLPANPLVGRTAELQAITQRLRADEVRVLTLIGMPGLGKTRLALEAAHALRFDFEDGVHFVELAPVAEAAHIPSTLANALGVKEQSGRTLAEAVTAHLRPQNTLLVLDNFEHVLEAAGFIADLLAACPAVKILVTSRAPLLIRAEQQHPLAPLAEADAVQLFAERVRALQPAFSVNQDNRAAIHALCVRLDYVPLAIELMAVRARSLSPAELLQQLEHRLSALESGPRDMPERQRTLRNAIAWSFELLDLAEQQTFAYLGVFAGGGTVGAVQAVAGESVTVLPALEALTQNSLVFTQTVAGETRFILLETIREYALEQLEQGHELYAAQSRHAAWFAQLAMEAYTKLTSAEAAQWSARIAAELDNIRAAFHWAMTYGAIDLAVQLATGIWRFHWMRGLLHEALARLEAVLERRTEIPAHMLSSAMRSAGTLANGLSDFKRARYWLEAALEVGRQSGDRRATQSAMTNLGFAFLEHGDFDLARQHLEDSLAITREDENAYWSKFPLSILGGLHVRAGAFAEAQVCYEESLSINRAYQDLEGMADSLHGLAKAVNAQGEAARARQLAEEGLSLHGALNHQLGLGFGHAALGDVARDAGEYGEALKQYQLCLRHWLGRENIVNCALIFDNLAHVHQHLHHDAVALKFLGAAAGLREKAGVKLTPYEQARHEATLAACQQAFSTFGGELAAGHVLTLEQAMQLALE